MAYRSSSSTSTVSGAAIDPGKPSGYASDDVLVMFLSANAVPSNGITAPSGWTLIGRNDETNHAVAAYWAVGSVASTSFGGGLVEFGAPLAICLAFSGRNTTAPITAYSLHGYYSGNDAQCIADSVSAAAGDDSLLLFGSNGTGGIGSVGGSYTTRANGTSASISASSETLDAVSAGATGNQVASAGAYQNKGGIQVALAAAAGSAVPVFVHHRKQQGAQ